MTEADERAVEAVAEKVLTTLAEIDWVKVAGTTDFRVGYAGMVIAFCHAMVEMSDHTRQTDKMLRDMLDVYIADDVKKRALAEYKGTAH